MEYEYYKQKYKAITIKLDLDRDSDVIDYLMQHSDQGPKAIICSLIRDALKEGAIDG